MVVSESPVYSITIGANAIKEIAFIGEFKNFFYKDLAQTFVEIKTGKKDGKWIVYQNKAKCLETV